MKGVVHRHGLFLAAGHRLQQVQKALPVPAAADEVGVQLGRLLRGYLGVAPAQGHHRLRRSPPGLAHRLAGLLVADGGDGAAIDNVDVGFFLKGDQGVALGQQQLLHGLGLVLVHFAA